MVRCWGFTTAGFYMSIRSEFSCLAKICISLSIRGFLLNIVADSLLGCRDVMIIKIAVRSYPSSALMNNI